MRPTSSKRNQLLATDLIKKKSITGDRPHQKEINSLPIVRRAK
jgi:hypothetical protein